MTELIGLRTPAAGSLAQAMPGGRCWILVLVSALIAACDAGPSESEFVTACLKEGARGANRALRREIGIAPDTFCRCAAGEARSQLSAEGQRVMVLDMQGKAGEARAISSKMKEADQMALMQGALAVLQKCAMPGR